MSELSVTPIILCGGAGSRLWPMSRDEKPKQFHKLFNEKSLLANTIERTPEGVFDGVRFKAHSILGSANLITAFKDELVKCKSPMDRIYLEPSVRDTAAAIAAITAAFAEDKPDDLVLVLPSDARIDDHAEFRKTIAMASRTAQISDAIMTIGITPTRAETQYGYIEQGTPLGEGYAVSKFREKPCAETAQAYLDSGKFVWNAGMFLFRVGRMAQEFDKLQPEIWKHAQAAVKNAHDDGVFVRLNADDFNAMPKLSMDYAIMEKADNIGVIPAHFDWDDMGSWTQLYDAAPKDDNGNAASGDAIVIDAKDNFIRTEGPLVALAGVEGLTVVAEDDKVLVVPTASAHLVKDVTGTFKERFSAQEMRAKGSKPAIKKWLLETALPFWAANGMDLENGGAHEALAFDGSAAPHTKKRLRVTARQIYCYAHASLMGWESNTKKTSTDYILRHCLATLIDTGWHKDGGFIHLYNPDGSVQDDTRDAYDQCFVLLAMAWLSRAKPWPEAREWGDKTLAYMDAHLADAVHGGYFENNMKTGLRRANPHMHFLEAMLAWHDATGEKQFLDRAEKIVDLFETHFFDTVSNTVLEHFEADWTPLAAGDLKAEPGHHYEWSWLLMRYNKLRPTAGLAAKARALYATANAFGHHAKTGAAADTMAIDGSSVAKNARCWSQTEALKAAIIFEEHGLSSAPHLRAQMLNILFKYYLDGPIPGGWYDAIDAGGDVSAPDMPSSTFYHVYCALVEHLNN